MKRRRRVITAVTAVLILVGATSALARSSFTTTIDQQAVWGTVSTNEVFFAGNVSSPKRACIADRKVKEIAFYPGNQLVLVDTDRTSKHGGWSTGGRLENNLDHVIAKVTRKRIGR